jgi:membrane protease YdiL (CAAX protease family)
MEFDYGVIWEKKISLLTYSALLFAILSLWIKRTPLLWGGFLSVAIVAGLLSQKLQWIGLAAIFLYGGIVYCTFHIKNRVLQSVFGIVAFVFSMLLWFHKIPGFNNWQIANGLLLSQDAFPLTMYLNFDKVLIGLFILGFSTLPLCSRTKKTMPSEQCHWNSTKTLALIAGSILVIGTLSLATGIVKFDLKFSHFFWIWALNNLVFVCVVEEVLFRGFLQRHLTQAFSQYRFGTVLALVVASIGFGLSHQGTATYLLLSTLCGLFYGIVYLKTKKIEVAIITHFLLNLIHIVGFSYPFLMKI